ncbi:hypothetical protein PsYK624_153170 [Phanerochaete sordida]|uniref:Uncharacterized protein n=1 Tax=Phanerochaete sordida TaxID=48140 RepID=A0A9P3GQM6_9APHY|nr:hypothetical protein PsYK624_153170 [Phanerochaete sordida]
MPPIITSITLKVVNQSVCYSGATYSNMLVPATDGVECMGNTEIQAGTLIFLLGGPKDPENETKLPF